MTVSYISSASAAATSVTMPTHQAGDLLVAVAFRDGSNTAPTIPSGWTSRDASGANTCSGVVAYKYAASSSETSGTWTNATGLVIHVYRGASIGAVAVGGSSGNTIQYPALTLQKTDSTSWVARFAGHRSATNLTTNTPSGYTARTGVATEARGCDTNGTVGSSPALANQSVNASSGWRAYTVEILANQVYYISAAGSNANDGLSTGAPWKDLTPVNAALAGTGIHEFRFRGGDTFTGNVYAYNASGTPSKPIKFTSYDTGRATITNSANSAFYVDSIGGVAIDNLNIVGGSTSYDGLNFYRTASGRSNYVQITNCVVSGWLHGLLMGGSTDGWSNVLIDNCVFHDNARDGAVLYGETSGHYAHQNVTIRNTSAYGNTGQTGFTTSHSGSGLILGSCDTGLIDYCTAYNNGANNGSSSVGPVGIWAYDSTGITIEHSISHHNTSSNSVDGGGFDLGINVSNSVIQHCVAYANKGPGIMLYGAGNMNNAGNVVRYNVSAGNAATNTYGEIYVANAYGAKVYNNTLVASHANNPPCVRLGVNVGSGTVFANNVFHRSGGSYIIYSESNYANTAAKFLQNTYYQSSFSIYWAGTTYSSLSAWRSAKTQETLSGVDLGYAGDPKLVAATTIPTVTYPNVLGSGVDNQKLALSTPLIGRGLHFSLLGETPPSTDMWGNPITYPPTIGAHHKAAAFDWGSRSAPSEPAALFTADYESGDIDVEFPGGYEQGGSDEIDDYIPTISTTPAPRSGSHCGTYRLNGAQYRNESVPSYDPEDEFVAKEGSDLWYGWSVRVPSNLPTTGWHNIGQWHQDPGPSTWGAAVLQFGPNTNWYHFGPSDDRQMTGDHWWLRGTDTNGDYIADWAVDCGAINYEEWTDFVVHARFSSIAANCFVEVWINGDQKCSMVPAAPLIDPNSPLGTTYFKVGQYRDGSLTADVTVAFDCVRIGHSYQQVAPPDAPPPEERPFFHDADWLWQPIPDSPVLHANSATWVGYFNASGKTITANLREFATTLVPASAVNGSTPRYDITFANVPAWGSDPHGTYSMPIPDGTMIPPGSDGQISVLDPITGVAFGIWQAVNGGSSWSASWGGRTLISGDGIDTDGKTTGCGLARHAGIVDPDALTAAAAAGTGLGHALFFSTDIAAPTTFVAPAASTDGVNMAGVATPIPEGYRVQLDPSIDVDAISGIPPGVAVIAKTLQTHGMYVGDNGGARIAIGFGSAPGSDPGTKYTALGFDWDYFDMRPWIDPSKLRVLKKWDGTA